MNIKKINQNKIKIDKNPQNNNLIYHIGYVTNKDLRYATIKSVNHLFLIIKKTNGYLMLVPTEDRKIH